MIGTAPVVVPSACVAVTPDHQRRARFAVYRDTRTRQNWYNKSYNELLRPANIASARTGDSRLHKSLLRLELGTCWDQLALVTATPYISAISRISSSLASSI